MKFFAPLCLLGLFSACSAPAEAESPAAEIEAPTFDEIAHFTRHSMKESRADNSCNCIEQGNCKEIRVHPRPGFLEHRNENCDWNTSIQSLDCTYDARFVDRVPMPSRNGEPIQFRDAPGNWTTRSINAKFLNNGDATKKWCILPLEYEEG